MRIPRLLSPPPVRASCLLGFISAVSAAAPAQAADWDLDARPARQRALAGAAVAGAEDAAAALTNPAGLVAEGRDASAYLSLGLEPTQREAGTQSGGSPLLSGWSIPAGGSLSVSAHLASWLAVGVGAGSLLREGATFESASSGDDTLALGVTEFGPQVAVALPTEDVVGPLRLGLGYQIAVGSIARAGSTAGGGALDISSGLSNASGFRLGLQASPLPELRLGLVVATPRALSGTSADGVLDTAPVDNVRADLNLPVSVTAGTRFDFDRFGVAVEYGYLDASELTLRYSGTDLGGNSVVVDQLPLGRDRHILRVGLEYRWSSRARFELPLRLGYRLETPIGHSATAVPFGPLAARLHVVAAGAGLSLRDWETSLAVDFGWGSGQGNPAGDCSVCGLAGSYGVRSVGVSLDVSYRFRL